MSLLSLFQKKSSDASSSDSDFRSRSAEESAGLRDTGSRPKRKSSRQASEPVDPMLPEKKRARRRLVGAIALVLAAVIGLPMILDAEQKPLGDEVAIQIPSKDQAVPIGGASGTTNGATNAAANTAASTAAKNTDNGAAKNSGSRIAANAALDPSEEVLNVPNTIAKPDVPRKPTPSTSTTLATADTSGAATEIVPKSRTEVRAATKVAKAAPPKEAVKTSQADTEPTDAARAQAILNGGSGSSGANSSATKTEKKNTKVIVQVAALASKEKVSELQDKLKAAGITSYTQTVATESGPRIRIRIGPLSSKEEADSLRGKLTKIGLNGTLVPS